MGSQVVTATEFKAKCLSLFDEIGKNGGVITITKRGQPVATVVPFKKRKLPSSRGILRGIVPATEELLNVGLSEQRVATGRKGTFRR